MLPSHQVTCPAPDDLTTDSESSLINITKALRDGSGSAEHRYRDLDSRLTCSAFAFVAALSALITNQQDWLVHSYVFNLSRLHGADAGRNKQTGPLLILLNMV